jgi:hypothetical protein
LKKAGVFTSRSLSGWDSDVFVGSSLVDMYAKCGSMEDDQRVFNNMPPHHLGMWSLATP